ncbi:GBS Bsp-like repeat-containing protein [Streptococcus marmotae]|uniref:GBS Bsp-like repeat-containing protein n=1 Tax=Streptococcus marmotae TaxID=1825069 RepID=UPI0008312B1D|nr:GBS Bsp-like repeat-containing protein [Streptococcus marmotae]
MKVKSFLYLSGLVLSCWNAQTVLADSITAEPKELGSQSTVSGTLRVVEEDGQVKVVFSGLTNGYGRPKATIWSQADKSDQRVISQFVQDSTGQYIAVLDKSQFAEGATHFYVEMSVTSDTNTSYVLDTYEFDWQTETTPSAAQSQASFRSIADDAQSSGTPVEETVGQPVTGDINIENIDAQNGTFDVVVSNVAAPSAIRMIQVPVWTDEGGQDDIRWYTATRQQDGTYKVTVNKQNHKNGTGAYHVHLYYKYVDGKSAGVAASGATLPQSQEAPTQSQVTGDIAIENIDAQAGTFDVVVSNVSGSSAIQTVQVPIWTEEGGQDDIRWYNAIRQADGTYKVTVDKKNHKNGTGKYHIHLYYRYTNGQLKGVGGTFTALPAPTPTQNQVTGDIAIENIDAQAGTFDVVVSNVSGSSAIQTVQVPIWTEEGGQDDIRWYNAIRQSDGTYKVTVDKKNHKNGTGKYHIHLYYRYTNGQLKGVGGTFTALPAPTPTQSQVTGDIAIENINAQAGTFDVVVSNVSGSSAIQTVQVPIWTEEGGQDDIRWYNAIRQSDGTYKVTVDKKNHKNGTGKYHIHLYYRYTNGQLKGVGGTFTALPAPTPIQNQVTGDIAIENINAQAGTFDVVVSNVSGSSAIQTVQVPIWTEEGGQDDIRWYNAIRQSDGTYKVTVDKRNHKNGTGKYHVHLYYRYTNGQLKGVGGTFTALPAPTPTQSQVTGDIAIENINAQAGTFDVVVSNVSGSSAIQTVQVPIWTEEGGQDDIRWYNAIRQADGTYKVTVDKRNHKNGTGKYHIHLYYRYTNGQLKGVGGTFTALPVDKDTTKPTGTLSIVNVNNQTGAFDVVVTDVSSPIELDSVLVPVWSEAGGQDDIRWYRAAKQADNSYKVHVEASNHKYSTGIYHAHLYYKQINGRTVGVGATKTSLSITQNGKPTATISIQNVDNTNGAFDVTVSDIFAPAGIDKVEVPVWSDVNGQNDIQWYTAMKQADGTYRVNVRVSAHRYETGLYHAHLYITSGGQRYGIGGTTTKVTYTHRADKSFVDVSSHNGSLSVSDYHDLLNQGVAGVVVKLTEGTSYLNPFAAEQIRNAQAVGMKVSVYHYSHFTDAKSAQEEARYFAAAAQRLGLSKDIAMVNDIEEQKTRNNINANMKAWEAEMRRLGYGNLLHYAGASWIDVNTLGYAGPIQTDLFGLKNFWVAQYPYNSLDVQQARTMSMHSSAAAWQFTSSAQLLAGKHRFDLNLDYTGRFTN